MTLCSDFKSEAAGSSGGAMVAGGALGGKGVEFWPKFMRPAFVKEDIKSAAPLTLGAAA